MTATLLRLEPGQIDATWPHIEQQITAAAKRSEGRYTADLVRGYAQKGLWQIWVALDEGGDILAVAGSQIVTYDTGLKALELVFGIGRQRKKWQHFIEDMKAWGKAQGCAKFQTISRIGWRRIFKTARHTHDFLEQDL